jgi:two-component system cell cycle response regulator DivK
MPMPKTVLIVEDNPLNLKLMRDLLEAQGIETVQTDQGAQVLELARKTKPDLILMDIQLPEVSGLDITRALRGDPALCAIPIIAVTALALRGDKERILEAGCDDYIAKPISVKKFLEQVAKHLASSGAQPDAQK